MNEKILVFIGGIILAVVTARKAYAPNRDEKLALKVGTPTPQPQCPESVEIGCGMPGPGSVCTDQIRRGTPFIQDCISAGLTRGITRPS
tara:strand:- start:406 stop:672 length:267 start_codon:yes stop_codon:yes gene_type:complete